MNISFRPSAKFDKSATVIFLTKEQVEKNKLTHLKSLPCASAIPELTKARHFCAEFGQSFPLTNKKNIILLVGLGSQKEITGRKLRNVTRSVLLQKNLSQKSEIEIVPHEQKTPTSQAIIEGILLGSYRWSKYLTEDKCLLKIKTCHLVTSKTKALEQAVQICSGVNLARDLVNENADVVTSSFMEKIIQGLIKGHRNVKIEILNAKEMKTKKLGLHLAVNKGSRNEPKLIIVRYQGGAQKAPYTAFVGKGMTFDTGGLNLKPTGGIENMRCDMAGSAAVVGTLKNILALKPKKNIIFAVGMAENVTGSGSYKPGDVLKSYNGKTVEVGNTDAEGRLVLADAISYLVRNYKPKRIIDIATLTGACVIALGHDYTGLVSSSDSLSRKLVQTSNKTDDLVWRLPNYPDLADAVKSDIADIRNLGYPRGSAGTLTAAEFLRQFTDGTEWAHLDIAGTGFFDGVARHYFHKGATGAGVRLLTDYLRNY